MVEILRKYKLAILALFILLLLYLVLIFQTSKLTKTQADKSNKTTMALSPTPASSNTIKSYPSIPSSISDSKDAKKIIAKVGEEIIYQKDLDTEISFYPIKSEQTKKDLLKKIIEDSKYLQIAKEEKLPNIGIIDDNIFNSPDKDYFKRVDSVQKIKKELSQATNLKGVIISIWFLNDRVGPLGYEKAKEIAFSKISSLHQRVKLGELTMRQAAELIKNDASLSQIDPTYKLNAFLEFNVPKGKKITWEEQFDNNLWYMKVGEISEIYTGKSYDFAKSKTEKFEAYYLFGQAEEENLSSSGYNSDSMFKEKEKNYEVVYY